MIVHCRRECRFCVHTPLLQQTNPAGYKKSEASSNESLEEGRLAGMLAPSLGTDGFGRVSNGLAVLLDHGPGLAEDYPGDQCIMPPIAQITVIKPGEFSLDNVAAFLK